jgi:transposase
MVGQWDRSYHDGGLPALIPRTRGRPKKMPQNPNPKPPPKDDQTRTREELLAEVEYLRMENAYLKKLDALIQAQKNATLRKPRK